MKTLIILLFTLCALSCTSKEKNEYREDKIKLWNEIEKTDHEIDSLYTVITKTPVNVIYRDTKLIKSYTDAVLLYCDKIDYHIELVREYVNMLDYNYWKSTKLNKNTFIDVKIWD